MSWSVSALGKVPAVRASIADQFSRGACQEPEESVRQAAKSVIDAALAAQHDKAVVKVDASGSMSFKDYTAKTDVSNTLTISIQPQYSFIE